MTQLYFQMQRCALSTFSTCIYFISFRSREDRFVGRYPGKVNPEIGIERKEPVCCLPGGHLESAPCSCGAVCCLFKRSDSESESDGAWGWDPVRGGGRRRRLWHLAVESEGVSGKEREGLEGGGCRSRAARVLRGALLFLPPLGWTWLR